MARKTTPKTPAKPRFDEELWGNATEDNSQYVRFDEDIPVIVEFQANDPYEIGENDYNQEVWDFEVLNEAGEEKILSTGSTRLKKALFKLMPLTEGRVCIIKHGTGVETVYNAYREGDESEEESEEA